MIPYTILKEIYGTIIENMTDGFAYNRIVSDPYGNPPDFIFIDVNKAFQQLAGLNKSEIIGRRATEVLPRFSNKRPEWLDIAAKTSFMGEKVRLLYPTIF